MKDLTVATVRDSAAMKQVCAHFLYWWHLTDNHLMMNSDLISHNGFPAC